MMMFYNARLFYNALLFYNARLFYLTVLLGFYHLHPTDSN